MDNFAPAYYNERNNAWLNQIVGGVIDPHHHNHPSCRTYGQDIDDDLVDDPDYQSENEVEGEDDEKNPRVRSTTPAESRSRSRSLHNNSRVASPSIYSQVTSAIPSRVASLKRVLSPSSQLPGTPPSSRAVSRLSGTSRRPPDGSSTVLMSPRSAFLTRPPKGPMPESTGRILEDGTLEALASPMTYVSAQQKNRDSMSTSQSPRPVSSPAPPYEEAVAKPAKLYKSLSSQRYGDGDIRPDLGRKLSSASTLTVESKFSGFAPHPAVRPLFSRAALGEAAGPENDDDAEYPTAIPLAMILIGICLSVFIISLDRNIITTAIPKITERFHSYDDIGWYGSAYLLTASAFQPLYGRIYMAFETKTSFLAALAVFEIGSLIGALAPTSAVLIIGRAIQGLGSAGILTGSFVVGTHSVRLSQRPILFAAVGILYGAGALCGPLLGGAFTDTIGWRWCFWINLPVGLITFLTVFMFFKRRTANSTDGRANWLSRVLKLDLIGNLFLLAAATQLFLALQFSETRFDWDSAPVIGLLCGFGVTTIIFIGWMLYKDEDALIPPRIARQRTVAASCGAAFFIYGTTLIHAYYLPIWFQAIKGASAVESGVNMIPYMLANAVFGLVAGIYVSKAGLFAPPAILGLAIGTVGCGMIATLKPTTSTATWIGFEILVSAGLGMAIQQGFSAVQTALPLNEVPIGTAAVVASQSCGGAIFVSVGNTLLQNHLLNANNQHAIPGNVNIRAVIEQGTTMFRDVVPPEALPALIKLYNESLQAVFIAAVPLCGVAFLCSLGMEWRSVKGRQSETGEKLAKKGQVQRSKSGSGKKGKKEMTEA